MIGGKCLGFLTYRSAFIASLVLAMMYCGGHMALVYYLYNDMGYLDWYRQWLIRPITYFAWLCMVLDFTLALLVLSLNGNIRCYLLSAWLGVVAVAIVVWLGYTAYVCQQLKVNAFMLMPGTQLMKAAAQSEGHKTAKMVGSTVAAMMVNPGSIEHVYYMLPSPVNLCFWWGIQLHYPALVFGLGSFSIFILQLAAGIALQPVLKAGGNGSEGVTADKIQLWYALAPKNRRILYQKELADIDLSEIDRLMGVSDSDIEGGGDEDLAAPSTQA
ncbi:hypothetical protein FOL47_007326 [Perkinsus chesapeaki]|uniref:Uncharacterized protein n=1 Tax=Perkinsus chesapeaki TaxID=330153 RepID=A0A7J6MVT7_PERCH|nr:hypothetical protein FOL47_007326 [Perkinsus chesapeaki]